MANIMDRWMRESLNALEVMETQRGEHESALEAAMDAIRRHTSQIERLERDIGVVREALEAVASDGEGRAAAEPVKVVAVAPPQPPPLRPVAGGRH
jgi:hypothetical protein